MTKIGEAAYDERGALAYGQPGDQTGLEVRILDMYDDANRPWSLVFRAKSQEVRDKLALAMTQACNNNNIGYAQYGDGTTPYKDRYGLRYAIDNDTPSHTIPDVTVPCNCDCSSLVAQCCRAAGIDIPSTMRTAQEQQILMATGQFDQLTYKKGMKLIPGDIMWRQGHTAIITSVSKGPDTTPKWVGKITAYCNVYQKDSLASPLLDAWPHLGKDNLVDVCDESNGFFYVRIAGQYYGYVEKKYVVNASEPQPVPPTPTPDPKIPFKGITNNKCTLYTGPSTGCLPCNVDRNDGLGIRNYLVKGEIENVSAKSGDFYQVEIKGAVYTWYPWVEKKFIDEYKNKDPQVGSSIKFNGGNLYTSAYGGSPVKVPTFTGKIVKIYNGQKHPYQVKADNGQYSGYADRKDFEVL